MKSYKVLIIDDDPNILNSTHIFLTEEGFNVSKAESGEKAVDMLRKGTYDLIITDLIMGQIDGIDVLKAAKKINPDTRVIILTGFKEMSLTIESIRNKADDYLLKPCEPDDLLYRMGNCFKELELIRKNRRTEQALIESEKRYRNLVESTHDQIWSIDIAGKHTFANKAITEILGYEVHEVIDEPVISFVHPDDKKNIKKLFINSIETKCGWNNVVNRWIHKDGSFRFIESSATPMIDSEGNLMGFSGVDRDITDRKRMEAEILQSKKLESISILSGGIAHHFNNIFGIILGNSELAMEEIPESFSGYSYVKNIKTASMRAAEIIKHLICFCQKNDPIINPNKVSLMIKESLDFIRTIIPSTVEIRHSINVTKDTILADPLQINQIMMNLCVNASPAMESDGGLIEVTVDNIYLDSKSINNNSDLKKGHYVQLKVRDTGSGIDPAIIDQIFDPFFTTRDIGKGFGMGLAVVHGIVKEHKGSISVESIIGKGTTFTILFPVYKEKTKINIIETDESDELVLGKERILFIDDIEDITVITKDLLEHLGYHVESTTDPREAINIFVKKPYMFDLVISDMAMPYMTGVTLFEKVKQIRNDIPFIICTGYSELINKEKAKKMGISDYVMKPIDRHNLSKIIRNVLDNKGIIRNDLS
ncbi:multi-sensor hybrid histidine kinase [Candidatus Magnetomorum sp. HK-1]|nr:multi-sensor hybrid histidine kinase [Candidatus Magnetomorum sp. HK-1]